MNAADANDLDVLAAIYNSDSAMDGAAIIAATGLTAAQLGNTLHKLLTAGRVERKAGGTYEITAAGVKALIASYITQQPPAPPSPPPAPARAAVDPAERLIAVIRPYRYRVPFAAAAAPVAGLVVALGSDGSFVVRKGSVEITLTPDEYAHMQAYQARMT